MSHDVDALAKRLRELATPERAKHGIPQDVAMLEAADALLAERDARVKAERERDTATEALRAFYITAANSNKLAFAVLEAIDRSKRDV